MKMDCNPYYEDAQWSLYRYIPSNAAPVAFCVLFALTTILHAIQIFRTRTWYLLALLTGGICETVGYATRAVNAREEPGCWSLNPYIVQNLLLLVAPPFIAASIYMILGRIILLTDGEAHAMVRRKWLTKIFVTGDVLSLLMQGSGGGMMAAGNETNNMVQIGENVITVGLFVQLVVFGFFVVVAGLFQYRMQLHPTTKCQEPAIRWRKYLLTLYVTSVIIWIRCLFRVIEYLQGNDGYLMRHEAFVFVFDGVLMFIVLAWMNWFHPAEIGLLLRGKVPGTNGLELIYVSPRAKVDAESSGSWSGQDACIEGDSLQAKQGV